MKSTKENNPQYSEELLSGKVLPLMEHFYTIQGEGYYQGKASYFIRLGGCDVGCHWCDVKESWDASKFNLIPANEIACLAKAGKSEIVVITGGEPLTFDMGPLTTALKEHGFRTHVETSGAYPLTGNWDWVCFSPKKFKAPIPGIYDKADELKVIVYNKSDFEWAESFAARVGENCRMFLQPEWSKQKEMLPLIIDYVKEHPRWEVSLQIHKYMDIP